METPKTFKELFANTSIEPTTDENGNIHYNFKATMKQEPKQETLEEAVKTYYEENIDQSNIPREHYEWEIQDLMLGFAYKWQQEQDKKGYSEEEVLQLLLTLQQTESYNNLYDWFEQNKKI
jgi:hypothetical protein